MINNSVRKKKITQMHTQNNTKMITYNVDNLTNNGMSPGVLIQIDLIRLQFPPPPRHHHLHLLDHAGKLYNVSHSNTIDNYVHV